MSVLSVDLLVAKFYSSYVWVCTVVDFLSPARSHKRTHMQNHHHTRAHTNRSSSIVFYLPFSLSLAHSLICLSLLFPYSCVCICCNFVCFPSIHFFSVLLFFRWLSFISFLLILVFWPLLLPSLETNPAHGFFGRSIGIF